VFFLIKLGITVAVAMFGYWQARQFVQGRLRFVDAVQKPAAPLLAGVAAAAIAAPFTLLPLITVGTALVFGGGVALGVNAGARQIRKRIGAG
jgi:hypothetical protein